MKHQQFPILLLLAFVSNSLFAQGRFNISGTLPADQSGIEIVLSSDNPAFKPVTSKAVNGSFSLSGEIMDEYEHVYLTVTRDGEHAAGWNFFIARGPAKVDILSIDRASAPHQIKFDKIPFTKEHGKYYAIIEQLEDSVRYADYVLRSVRKGVLKQYKEDSVTNALRSLKNQRLARKIDFIKSNQDSYFGLHVFNKDVLTSVSSIHMTPDSLRNIFLGFTESLKQSNLGRDAYAYIVKRQSLVINETMPDFSFLTFDNQPYQLSSFRDKNYVLLCFWDSWCRPCIESIPLLKSINESYGKELQIVSVSIDKDVNRWKNSLKKYPMPWLQTCDINSFVPGEPVASLYDIKYIPQYFLIGKERKLIYHNTQLNDDEGLIVLQKMLKELIR